MGAILAMMSRMFLRSVAAICTMIVLAGCSSSGSSSTPLINFFTTFSAQMGSRDASARDARSVLTPAIVAAAEQPYLLVELPTRQASATRFLFSQRGYIQDWRGEDGISLILHDDVLVGTRGLGADLFAADPLPPGALRSGRTDAYKRVYRHLDAENRQASRSYSCTLASGGTAQVDLIARQVETRRLVETCKEQDQGHPPIVNEYWIGKADNLLWKSKQWVSESVEYATFFHLVR